MGQPINLGDQGGGLDRNKLLLIGGVLVAAVVLLNKSRGGGGGDGGGDQVVPVQAIQLGQLDYDLRNATNDLAQRIADAQADQQTYRGQLGDYLNRQFNALAVQDQQFHGETLEMIRNTTQRLSEEGAGRQLALGNYLNRYLANPQLAREARAGRDYSFELFNGPRRPAEGDERLQGA
jgi:hypothetical protein